MAFLYPKKPLRHTKFGVEATQSPFHLMETLFATRNIYRNLDSQDIPTAVLYGVLISGMRGSWQLSASHVY